MKYTRSILKMAMIVLPTGVAQVSVAQQAAADAPAQAPVHNNNGTAKPANPSDAELGGTPSLDIINLGQAGPGAPLRFGNVIPKSEKVSLNGIYLTAGRDYSMDYASGVVYLQRAQKAGDNLSVSYRYSKTPVKNADGGILGNKAMKFNLLPGAANMFMGFGATDRTADGKVIRSNVYGTQNSFSMGSGSLKGAYFMGERSQAQVAGGLNFDSAARGGNAEGTTGNSKFLVQSFGTKVGGASFFANMQDVSTNFSGFSAVQEAGYSEADVNTYRKERGLVRKSMGMNDLSLGGLKLSASDQSLGDGQASLNWQNYSLAQKGFQFNVQNQRVEQGFARFNDIREDNRQQLQREQGLARSNMGAMLEQKFGKLSFSSNNIEEFATGRAINRQEVKLDTKNFAVVYGDQTVDNSFNRFGSLLGNEQALYGLEAGLNRQWLGFNTGILGKDTQLKFNSGSLGNASARYEEQSYGLVAKTWSFEHIGKNATAGFNRMHSMSQPEQDRNIQDIAKMYGPGAAMRAEDRGAFFNSQGIERSYNRVASKIGKSGDVSFENLKLKGQTDESAMNTLNVTAKNFQVMIRKTDVGEAFADGSRLMTFERERLGTVPGLNRLDMSVNTQLGGGRSMSFANTSADVNGQGFDRTSFAYGSKNLEVSFNSRSVDKGYAGMGQFLDTDRDLLGSLAGFKQSDARFVYKPFANLNIEYGMFQASNGFTQEDRSQSNLALNWSIDPTLKLQYSRQGQSSGDANSLILAQSAERLHVSKQLGKTQLQISDETRSNDGRINNQLDSRRQSVAVETQVSKTTSLRTEQTRTDFQNGENEKVSANSVNTRVAKNVGVTITDTKIDREGDVRDETRRDYGLSVDFGKGLRLSFGQARHLNGLENGTSTTSLAFGQDANRINPDQANTVRGGNVNGTMVGFASGANSWDNQFGRTQAFSSFNLQTTKPFNVGVLGLSKSSLSVAMDMASDNQNWLRENQTVGFSSNIGRYSLGYDFRGQVNNQGQRAADRSVKFKTDPTDKQPLSASMQYKMRSLADGSQFAIRDMKLSYKPAKGLEISNSVQTNPEQANPNVILGSMPLADRRNEWKVGYTSNQNWSLSGLWQEQLNDFNGSLSRTSGLNLGLFQKSGSPLNLFFGVEQSDGINSRRTLSRWHIEFNQKASQNQVFSLFLGNLSYEGPQGNGNPNANNWTARLNYQLKF